MAILQSTTISGSLTMSGSAALTGNVTLNYFSSSVSGAIAPIAAVWAAGGALGTARYGMGSAGTATAALAFGG